MVDTGLAVGLGVGIPLVLGIITIIVLALLGVFSNSSTSNAASPTMTFVPTELEEQGVTSLKILASTSNTVIDFQTAFGDTPVVTSAIVIDSQKLGTPNAVVSVTPTSNSEATINLSLGNFPVVNPADKTVGPLSGANASLGILSDSLGNVWVSALKPSETTRSIYTKTESGIGSVDFAPVQDGPVNPADGVGATFWHETSDGNVITFAGYVASAGTPSFEGLYGPATGSVLSTACTGFTNGRPIGGQVFTSPSNPNRVFLPYHETSVSTRVYESLNGGKDWQPSVQVNPGFGIRMPTMAFYNDNEAILAFSTNTATLRISHFDGTSWTDQGVVAGITDIITSAQTVLLEGTIAVFYSLTSTRNLFVIFSEDNNAGSVWSAPLDIGPIGDLFIRDIRAGTSNGIPWVVCHENGNIVRGRYCRQSDGKANWSERLDLGDSFFSNNGMDTDYIDDGVVFCVAKTNTEIVYNYLPTAARVQWQVEGL